jgi:lysyl-tRNA synthetase class 2
MEELSLNQVQQQRLNVIEEMRREGLEPFGRRFERTHDTLTAREAFEQGEKQRTAPPEEEFILPGIALAGRLITKREQGKTAFCHIEDQNGRIQIYIRKDAIGDDAFALVKRLYAGDIIGIHGGMFRTRTGEITLRASSLTVLSKAVNPMPEKWHGLTDVEMRYRQRYVDLMANADVRNVFIKRSRIVQFIREFMTGRNFLEVETPMMHPIAGGAAARPFITHHNTLDMDLFLRIAPELYLKRLLVGGFEKVFEINRNFRNEGISIKHNPEFTMLETYEAFGDINSMLELTESLICHATSRLYPDFQVPYQGETLNFSSPWARRPMIDTVREVLGLPELQFSTPRNQLAPKVQALGIAIAPSDTTAGLIVKVFEEKVEPTLKNPTFIVDYPKEISPLAKGKPDNPELVDRFELFIAGRETANAFSELNDPMEQRSRFLDQLKQRAGGNDEAHQMDEDYINALCYGMPPAGGMGMGIDRLVMVLTDSASIRDVILFPTMRKRDATTIAAEEGNTATASPGTDAAPRE